MKKAIYFPGLNGIRAIAALAVVFAHTTMRLDLFGLDKFILGRYPDGNPLSTLLAGYGVSMFFSLSGFLITYLLLEEKKVKEINLKHFYIRRILRIWPLYYLYLVLSLITVYIYDLPIDKSAVLFTVFLMANIPFITGGITQFLGHYWSLGVEEQFYAFWPLIMKRTGLKSILKVTVISTLVLIILKVITRSEILQVTRFHCMLIGAIGAILYNEKNIRFIKIASHWIAQVISWSIILLVAINYFHIASIIDGEIVCLVTVILIIGQIEGTGILKLENTLCNFLGKISYGIYIIHPLVIFYLSKIVKELDPKYLFDYFLMYTGVLVFTITMAWISYELFEKRFLLRKQKYTYIKSNDHL